MKLQIGLLVYAQEEKILKASESQKETKESYSILMIYFQVS